MKKIQKSIKFGGKTLTFETGGIAEQASGAVMATYGDTVVLATVVAAELKNDPGYFPLTVEYQEKLYAGGRIKGSRWVKREGRPSDDEILTARLIDRSIRPLFPKEYYKEVQVICTVLSIDLESSPDVLAAIATSAALSTSSIPWNGPVSVVRVGVENGGFVINPPDKNLANSELDIIVSSTKDSIVMLEAGADQVPEDKILEAIDLARKEGQKLIKVINEFASEVGRKKDPIEKEKTDQELGKKIQSLIKDKLGDLVQQMSNKEAGYGEYELLKSALISEFEDEKAKDVGDAFDELFNNEVRRILLLGKRPDGRRINQIRRLSSKVGVLPRTHGSAVFERGQTQVLTIATLGAKSLEQLIESAEGEESKRYIHHYEMPPYSTGETGRVGFPRRREIGHGALAERALLPVIPDEKTFPYTIRVVTEVLSSNGSTSMASACGSTLSLMDAGVPIVSPVAGIAMGLIVEDRNKYVVLTDIVGIEDGSGDMDLKVAGTEKGITALQLDVKTLKLDLEILKDAVNQAKKARDEILRSMLSTISKPREKVSPYAPKIRVITIDIDKIGELIGPGGRTIKKLSAETETEIDVEDNGSVTVSAIDEEKVKIAIEKIEALTREVSPGEIYEGGVTRLEPYGAFVEILPGKVGLVHVSDMKEEYVDNPKDVVSLGDKVKVRVKDNEMGKISLSMLLQGDKKQNRARGSSQRGGFDRRQKSFSGRPRRRMSKGPHFPTSRYLEEGGKGFRR